LERFFFKKAENLFQSLMFLIYTRLNGLVKRFFQIFSKKFLSAGYAQILNPDGFPACVPFLALKNRKEPGDIIRYKEYGQSINGISNNQDIQHQPNYFEKAGK
jgi:hypothetical protein